LSHELEDARQLGRDAQTPAPVVIIAPPSVLLKLTHRIGFDRDVSMALLQGTGLLLRPASPNDAAARLLGTDAEIARMFGVSRSDAKPMTRDAAEEWAQSQAKNPYAWMIEVERQLIGEIKLHTLNLQDRRASMAIAIYNPALLGKGLGSEATRVLLQHVFTQLDLHRVGIRVLAYNERAIRAYQKCGFVVEGRERETAFVDGKWYDDLMMGLLSAEFRP
jgi:RimJ/RimL family protein N-acetyltransferase